jgi:hypothetical protein
MASDVEHFFTFFLLFSFCTSSFEKALFISFPNFFSEPLIIWEFRVFFFFLFSLLLVYSGYESFVTCLASKDFLPFCVLPLQSGDCFLCCTQIIFSLFIYSYVHKLFGPSLPLVSTPSLSLPLP